MRKLVVAAVAVGVIAVFNLVPQPAQARNCSILTATAQGATQTIAINRADRRIRRYARRNLSGWGVEAGPRNDCQGWGSENNLRPTCQTAVVVCQ